MDRTRKDSDFSDVISMLGFLSIFILIGFAIGVDYSNGGIFDDNTPEIGEYQEMINSMNLSGDCIKVFQKDWDHNQYDAEYYVKTNINGTDTWVLIKDVPVQSLGTVSSFEKDGDDYYIEYCQKLVKNG